MISATFMKELLIKRHLLKHGTGRNGTERKKDGTGGTLRNRLLWNTEQRRNKQNAKRRNRRNETEHRILRNTEHRRNIRIANGRNDTEHNYTIIRNTERIYGTQLLQYVTSKVAKHRRLKSLRCFYNHCRSLG